MLHSQQPCCPRCGGDLKVPPDISYTIDKGTLSGVLGSSEYAVRFTKSEGMIFELLWRRRNGGSVSREMILDHLYRDDPDGGPLDPIVKVYIWKIRRKLRGTDIEIVTDHHRGYWLRTRKQGAVA